MNAQLSHYGLMMARTSGEVLAQTVLGERGIARHEPYVLARF